MTARAASRNSSRPRAVHSDTGSACAAPSAFPAVRRARSADIPDGYSPGAPGRSADAEKPQNDPRPTTLVHESLDRVAHRTFGLAGSQAHRRLLCTVDHGQDIGPTPACGAYDTRPLRRQARRR